MKIFAFKAKSAVWLKDGVRLKNESGLQIQISNAGVETDRNYTCIPFNQVMNHEALLMPYPVLSTRLGRAQDHQ